MSLGVLLAGPPGGILAPARAALERDGFLVTSVASPDLLHAFRAGPPPSLVIVDVAFGLSGGVSFCRGLREEGPWRAVSLVLAVSVGAEHLEECLVAGINDFLVAPFRGEEVVLKARRLTAVPQRIPATGLVSIRGGRPDGGTAVGTTVNLSARGLLVESESALSIGRVVDLVLYLPDGGPPASFRVRVVRRATEVALFHPAYGLEYDEISKPDLARIEAWAASQGPAEGLSPLSGR